MKSKGTLLPQGAVIVKHGEKNWQLLYGEITFSCSTLEQLLEKCASRFELT